MKKSVLTEAETAQYLQEIGKTEEDLSKNATPRSSLTGMRAAKFFWALKSVPDALSALAARLSQNKNSSSN